MRVNLSPSDWKRTRFASRYAIAAIKTKSAYRAMLPEHHASQNAARSAPRGLTENQGFLTRAGGFWLCTRCR